MKAAYDDLNTPAIALVGFCSAIATFVVIVGLQVVYYRFENTYRSQQEGVYQSVEEANLLAQQQAALADYAWIDRSADRVAIPIDRAMALVVRELSATANRPNR